MSSIPSGQQGSSSSSSTAANAAANAAASAVPSSKPEKLWIWIEGGESNELANKVMKDVGTVFQEFKEKLASKLYTERSSGNPSDEWGVDKFNVDINLKTKKVEIQLKSDPKKIMTLDLRSMEKSAENSALWDTAKKIEHLLRDHKLLIETKDSLDNHADAIFKHELAPRKGEDGFIKSINRLPVHDVTAEMMINAQPTGKEKGSLGLCHQLIETRNSINPIDVTGVKNKIAEAMKQQEKILNQNLAFLKKQLEKRKSDIEKGTDELVVRDAKLLQKQIAEYENVPRGLLQLVLTLRELDGPAIPTRFEMKNRAENIYKVIIQLFERDEHIGVSATGKDGKAKHVITREHEKLAAIIAAAATFSHTIVPNEPSAPKEYGKIFQDGYQKFLERHLVDPNTHLGVIGSLLRLETVDQITSDEGIKDTEIHSLVDTRGMSSTLVDQINGHLRGLFPSSAAAVHIGNINRPGAAVTNQTSASAASTPAATPPIGKRRRGNLVEELERIRLRREAAKQSAATAAATTPTTASAASAAARAANGTVVCDPQFDNMRDEVVEIDPNNSIGIINNNPIPKVRPATVQVMESQRGSLGVGEEIRKQFHAKTIKIGYGIAASSAAPWGGSATLLQDPTKDVHGMTVAKMGVENIPVQEESCVNSFLLKECNRIKHMSLGDQREEVRFLHNKAQNFYKNNPNKINYGYNVRAVEGFINVTIPGLVNQQNGYLELKRLLFAAYAKDRWGMKDPVGGTIDTNAFFGKEAVDYTKSPDANVYSRAFTHTLGRSSEDQFIYASVANADPNGGNTNTGGMKRTSNPKAINNYAYFRETVKYALIGQLRLAAETGCTHFVASRLGNGVYAGNHMASKANGWKQPPQSQNIKVDFQNILNEALDVKVTTGGQEVRLRDLFDSVTIADVKRPPKP